MYDGMGGGSIQGLVQAVSVVGGMLGPVLMGVVFDLTGSYVLAIYFIMFVAAAAIPLLFLARPPSFDAPEDVAS